MKELGVLSAKRIERGEPGEFDRMSDDELRQAVADRAEQLGLHSSQAVVDRPYSINLTTAVCTKAFRERPGPRMSCGLLALFWVIWPHVSSYAESDRNSDLRARRLSANRRHRSGVIQSPRWRWPILCLER